MDQAQALFSIYTAATTSPSNCRSDLYDGYELKAVMKQLNRAIQGSKQPLSPTSYFLMNSPYCRRRLHGIYRENAKGARKVSGFPGDHKRISAAKTAGGFGRLWKKVKQTFLAQNN